VAVKIDSTGLQPEVISTLADMRCIDYAAIDVKTSPEKYSTLTDREVDFSKITESINILRDAGIDYEVRTTCVPGYVTMEDLAVIGDTIGHVKKYCLQQFNRAVPLMDRSWEVIEPYPTQTLAQFRNYVQTFADTCEIRGI
jgi:pyruvate formate lyase activating enzyme